MFKNAKMTLSIMWNATQRFLKDASAEPAGGGVVGTVIMFAVGLYVIAAVVPAAIGNITAANTTQMGTGAGLWGILPLVAIAGIVMLVLGVFL